MSTNKPKSARNTRTASPNPAPVRTSAPDSHRTHQNGQRHTPSITRHATLTRSRAPKRARGLLLLAATTVAGLQAGTYFTWATGVMPGLAHVDDATFIDSMQQMNIAIVNPTFMATFVGAPLLASAAAVLSDHRARPWAIAASALTIGTLAITLRGNVPLNDALQAAGPVDKITDLAGVRAAFESPWVKLNIARCLTSAGALACLARATHCCGDPSST